MTLDNVRPYSEFIAHNRRPLTELEQQEVSRDIKPYAHMLPINGKPGCSISEARAATLARDLLDARKAHNVQVRAERAERIAAVEALVVYGD
jgi:hypothetical protein